MLVPGSPRRPVGAGGNGPETRRVSTPPGGRESQRLVPGPCRAGGWRGGTCLACPSGPGPTRGPGSRDSSFPRSPPGRVAADPPGLPQAAREGSRTGVSGAGRRHGVQSDRAHTKPGRRPPAGPGTTPATPSGRRRRRSGARTPETVAAKRTCAHSPSSGTGGWEWPLPPRSLRPGEGIPPFSRTSPSRRLPCRCTLRRDTAASESNSSPSLSPASGTPCTPAPGIVGSSSVAGCASSCVQPTTEGLLRGPLHSCTKRHPPSRNDNWIAT